MRAMARGGESISIQGELRRISGAELLQLRSRADDGGRVPHPRHEHRRIGKLHHRQRGRRWYVPRRAHRHGVVLRRRARQGTIPPARPRNQAQRRSRARNRARRHDRHSITIRHRFRPRRRGRPRAVPAPRPSMRPRKASPRGPAPIRGHLRPAHRVDVARAQTLAQQHVTRIRSS